MHKDTGNCNFYHRLFVNSLKFVLFISLDNKSQFDNIEKNNNHLTVFCIDPIVVYFVNVKANNTNLRNFSDFNNIKAKLF